MAVQNYTILYAAEKSYVIKSAVFPEVSDKLLQQSGVTYIQAVSMCVCCVCHSGSVKAGHSAMKVLWVAMMNCKRERVERITKETPLYKRKLFLSLHMSQNT